MANYTVLSLSESQKWNEFLEKIPANLKDVYYTPEYYQLYENLGNGKAVCFVYEEEESIALYPFLLNSVNKHGYNLEKEYLDIQGAYGYNGVVANNNSSEFCSRFYEVFNNFIQVKSIIAEFTRFHPLLNNHLFSQKYLDINLDRKTVYLDLQDSYENIFSRFQTTTKKQIKRATNRYNLVVKVFKNDTSILDDFISIYNEAMGRVQSTNYLLFNNNYFKSLFEIANNVCFIAYHNQKPIACIYAFYNNHFINGHLGGSLSDYLFMSPFSLLYSEMIKFGISVKCKYLHVGGGSTSNPENSLLSFKLNFSKSTSDFFIGKKIHNQAIYDEVISQWEKKYPEKLNIDRNMLLKYYS
jgi:hypothetical protein